MFSTLTLLNAERQAGKLKYQNLSLLVWLGQGIETRSTDYEVYALYHAPGAGNHAPD